MQDPNQISTQLSSVIQNDDNLEKLKSMQEKINALATTFDFSEEDIDYIYDYIKHTYNDTNYNINNKLFDNLMKKINRFKNKFPQIYLIHAHCYNLLFIQSNSESYRWQSFLHVKNYELIKTEILDNFTRNYYDNLQQWFEQTQRGSHAKIGKHPILFKNKNYGTSTPCKQNSAQDKGLLDLPNDILLLIMSTLSLSDLSALCKSHTRFYHLFHNIQLWDNLERTSFMTDRDYLNHCEKNLKFYHYNSRQRIRDFCAKPLPYTQIDFTYNDRPCFKKFLEYKLKIIGVLCILAALGVDIYLLYPDWTDKNKTILDKMGDTLGILMLSIPGTFMLGMFILSCAFYSTLGIDFILQILRAIPHNQQTNERNTRLEKFRITSSQSINHENEDIEAQTTTAENSYKTTGATI